MTKSVSLEELKKIPYLKTELLNGRVAPLIPYWDGTDWYLWLVNEKNELIQVRPVDTYDALYVAKEKPAKPTDLEIPFISLMWQRASYPDIAKVVSAISQDFQNMGLSLAKIEHIFDTRGVIKSGNVRGYISTEVEYLFVLSRSVFDLLYEVIYTLWSNTKLSDSEAERKKKSRSLPKSLSKFIFKSGKSRSCQDMMDDFGLPEALTKEIEKHIQFICRLREARDLIVHNGKSLGAIFETEKGFCVDANAKPFSEFYSRVDISSLKYGDNDLVSLWPWLSHVVLGTVNACNGIVHAFASVILLPPEMAPDHKVFVRDPSSHSLIRALEVAKGGYPWWDSQPT